MKNNKFLIITSIASDDNIVLNAYAKICVDSNINFLIIGDIKSPVSNKFSGNVYYSIKEQEKLGYSLHSILPYNHYSRKNLGYLRAVELAATLIIETDDDNLPLENFLEINEEFINVNSLENIGWVNIYKFFTNKIIWPRGFPLEKIDATNFFDAHVALIEPKLKQVPIQQYLANGNPDVDAIYRLTRTLPFEFEDKPSIALGKNSFCPFNSQNTVWYKTAHPLLYLPSYCSFRMTDIWRSFVAQRICWEYDWCILFSKPSVYQERNDHNLLKDFEEEVCGYLSNDLIYREFSALKLSNKNGSIFDNMLICYSKLIDMKLIDSKEFQLLQSWINDYKSLSK